MMLAIIAIAAEKWGNANLKTVLFKRYSLSVRKIKLEFYRYPLTMQIRLEELLCRYQELILKAWCYHVCASKNRNLKYV